MLLCSCALLLHLPFGSRLRSCQAGHLQIARIEASNAAGAAPHEPGDKVKLLFERVAAAVARTEALPQDELRQAHPRERCLEDVRLEQPELIVGCWASG